jgi:hypothetical protein
MRHRQAPSCDMPMCEQDFELIPQKSPRDEEANQVITKIRNEVE